MICLYSVSASVCSFQGNHKGNIVAGLEKALKSDNIFNGDPDFPDERLVLITDGAPITDKTREVLQIADQKSVRIIVIGKVIV